MHVRMNTGRAGMHGADLAYVRCLFDFEIGFRF